MDNLTHTLFGLAAGELVQRSLPAEADSQTQPTRANMLRIAGFAASNFPDLNLFATRLLPAPLGYLLHHRGHTHTLLYALPQALLLAALIWLLWPAARRLLQASPAARTGLAICCLGGLALHIGFDFLNSYGVHPFYPFDGRWVYGDLVFILEPVFWVGFGIPVAMALRARLPRWLLLAILPLLAVLAAKGYLLWGATGVLIAAGAGLIALGRRAGERGRQALAAGMAMAALFVLGQAAAGSTARHTLASGLGDGGALVDAAITAYPANPLCWSVATVQRDRAGDALVVRRGVVSVLPSVLPASACPAAMGQPGSGSAALVLSWEHRASLQRLRQLASDDCHVAAWLRFARIPALSADRAGDARFGPGDNFSTLQLDAHQPCPAYVPGWSMPRADLLTGFPAPAR